MRLTYSSLALLAVLGCSWFPRTQAYDDRFAVNFTIALDPHNGEEAAVEEMIVAVNPAWAPKGAERFRELTDAGFFNENYFFRFEYEMVHFGINGDPLVEEYWWNSKIADDHKKKGIDNVRGTVAFANTLRNMRAAEIIFNMKDNKPLDSHMVRPFGVIVENLNVLKKLNKEYSKLPSCMIKDPNLEGGMKCDPIGAYRPDKFEIRRKGNVYVEENYPRMSMIRTAEVMPYEEALAAGYLDIVGDHEEHTSWPRLAAWILLGCYSFRFVLFLLLRTVFKKEMWLHGHDLVIGAAIVWTILSCVFTLAHTPWFETMSPYHPFHAALVFAPQQCAFLFALWLRGEGNDRRVCLLMILLSLFALFHILVPLWHDEAGGVPLPNLISIILSLLMFVIGSLSTMMFGLERVALFGVLYGLVGFMDIAIATDALKKSSIALGYISIEIFTVYVVKMRLPYFFHFDRSVVYQAVDGTYEDGGDHED